MSKIKKEVSVNDVQIAATSMGIIALIVLIFYFIGLITWFPVIFTSPFALIGLGILLLTAFLHGRVAGVAYLLEKADEKRNENINK